MFLQELSPINFTCRKYQSLSCLQEHSPARYHWISHCVCEACVWCVCVWDVCVWGVWETPLESRYLNVSPCRRWLSTSLAARERPLSSVCISTLTSAAPPRHSPTRASSNQTELLCCGTKKVGQNQNSSMKKICWFIIFIHLFNKPLWCSLTANSFLFIYGEIRVSIAQHGDKQVYISFSWTAHPNNMTDESIRSTNWSISRLSGPRSV